MKKGHKHFQHHSVGYQAEREEGESKSYPPNHSHKLEKDFEGDVVPKKSTKKMDKEFEKKENKEN